MQVDFLPGLDVISLVCVCEAGRLNTRQQLGPSCLQQGEKVLALRSRWKTRNREENGDAVS